MLNFKKEVEKARHFYFNIWRGNEKPCPAFNGEVVRVTRAGWNHLRFSIRRNDYEVRSRLSLLDSAKYILETQKKIRHHRGEGETEYWGLEGYAKNKIIRVVVRSINSGDKHFFSVFIRKELKRKKPLLRLDPR